MAMTLADVRQLARGLYGLEYSTTEDQLYQNPFLNKLVNKAHHWFAGVTRCYYDDAQAITLIATQQSYALANTVIEPDIRTFRVLISTTYTRLKCRYFHSLLEQYGALESVAAVATPTDFYIRAGTANAAVKKIEIVPKPSGIGTVYFGAWIYPAELSADSDTLPLADPDIYRLVSAICWQMAEFDASRGRPDAPVALWAQRAMAEAIELQRIIRHGTREFSRTPEVSGSPLEDVADRRRPVALYGGPGAGG
jgi:hypothetical protein